VADPASPASAASAADLYAIDPRQFVAARDALAKRLKADGQSDEANRVAKRRRPPPTAWALNQVARNQPELVAGVLESGARLRSAMEQAVAGDASGLRAAQTEHRPAIDAAVAAAANYLSDAGLPAADTARQRMTATLGAAVVDDAAAAELREGTLDVDRAAPGFGLDAMSVPARPAPATRKAAPATPAAPTAPAGPSKRDAGADGRPGQAGKPEQQAAKERLRQAKARYAQLDGKAQRLSRLADRRRGEADKAERDAVAARKAADQARSDAAEARRLADAARPDDG
jgi:hypothetical protein